MSIADEVSFDIPDSWEWVRVRSCTELYNGRAFKPTDWTQDGLPIVRIQNLNDHNAPFNRYDKQVDEEVHLYGGELLFAWSGTPGTSFGAHIWDRGEAVLNQHIFKLVFNEDCLFKPYFMYALNERVGSLIKAAHGSAGLQHVTRGVFESTLIPLPPYEEQIRIVKKLAEIEPLIQQYGSAYEESQNLNSAFPEQLKKSILQIAVQGKLVPQDPDDEPASVLLERIRAEKERLIREGRIKRDKNESVIYRRDNSHYEKLGSIEQCIDDEIPFEIPTAWSWVRLRYISFKITDGTHKTPSYLEEGVPFVSAKDVIDGLLSFRKCRYISEDEHQKLSERCNPEKGDLLITKSGTIGSVAVINDDFRFSLFESLALVKYDQHNIDKNYLRYSIQSAFEYLSKDNIRGVAVKHLPIDSITNILIPLPSFAEQQRIVQQIEAILPMVKSL